MWKKTAYGVLILILLYFIYAVFFKKIPSPLEQLQKEMKAKKVVYKLRDELIVYADEQIGSPKGDIVKFKGVIIDLLKKDMIISGKEGELNTKTSDILLKKKVIGATKDKKWSMFTEEAQYKKEGDLIISPVRTKILNSVDDTRLEADRIETTTKFEIINGAGNIVYVDNKEKRDMRAEKAIYNGTTKILEAEGNVVYKDKKEHRDLRANKMRYDEANKVLDGEGNVVFNDRKEKRDLKANKMRYDDINKVLDAEGNVFYKDNKEKRDLSGHKMRYNDISKVIEGEGNVVFNDNKENRSLKAQKMRYDDINKVIEGEGNVFYDDRKEKRDLSAQKMSYNDKTKVIEAEGSAVYNDKKENRKLRANKMRYDDINKVGTAEGNAIYNDFKEKRELKGDWLKFDDKNKIGNAVGNVRYTDPENTLSGHKVDYFMNEGRIYGEGNVVYSGRGINARADRVTYWEKTRQIEGFGNVRYSGNDMIVTGDHVFYDDKTKVINGDGNGTFNHIKRQTTGTFQKATYDMKSETLVAPQAYTVNYEDYRMMGTNLVYLMKTGDATFNEAFSVTKQNFTVSGANGKMNTITKDIFANRMLMTSLQGDMISSDIGQGSFEKKEFRFDGNVNGKIRGNVKNFMTNPTMLVDSEAVHFRGDNAKLYFISQNNKNMSVTRGEIKNNVHLVYKDVVMDSQYTEIDIAKNTVMARDKITVDFRNETKMTANYIWFDMNKEEGHAENNVKVISKLPQMKNVNTSANKATIDLKGKKVKLNGNILIYQGRTSISSKDATYDMQNKIIENSGNVKMRYQLNTNGSSSSANEAIAGKSNPDDIAAVNEIINNLEVQSTANSGEKITLPRSMTASNGKTVAIKWNSSNSTFLPVTGRVNKQFYGGGSRGVTLKATVKSGNETKEKSFDVAIPVETAQEMLVRAAKNIYVPEEGRELPSSVRVNISKGTIDVPVSWTLNGASTDISGAGNLKATLSYDGVSYSKSY